MLSVRATFTFTVVLERFLIRDRFGTRGSPGTSFVYLFHWFYNVSCLCGQSSRTIARVCEGLLHFLAWFGGRVDVLGGVSIIMSFCYSSYAKMFLNSLVSLLGGSLGSLLFLASLGNLFYRVGRCPNHDDFLLQFISQSVPKLVLVTLGGTFRASMGGSLVIPWLHKT